MEFFTYVPWLITELLWLHRTKYIFSLNSLSILFWIKHFNLPQKAFVCKQLKNICSSVSRDSSHKLHWPLSFTIFILYRMYLHVDMRIRGRLQRTSAKISDFQTTPPPLVRVCPNFQNHPPPRTSASGFFNFTHFSILHIFKFLHIFIFA